MASTSTNIFKHMTPLIFATGNKHKVQEVREILDGTFDIRSLEDIGCTEDIPETADTFEGNALLKARYVAQHFNMDCFAEDTGLEIDALDGAPGVYSARYAGIDKDSTANIKLVLKNLAGQTNRKAQFRTVIALIIDGEELTFEGIVRGHIAESPSGTGGFGYDPIFVPEGYDRTFGELPAETKHAISHRGRAMQKLLEFLKTR
jgi:XTP/dITP diphosphohydrolase